MLNVNVLSLLWVANRKVAKKDQFELYCQMLKCSFLKSTFVFTLLVEQENEAVCVNTKSTICMPYYFAKM